VGSVPLDNIRKYAGRTLKNMPSPKLSRLHRGKRNSITSQRGEAQGEPPNSRKSGKLMGDLGTDSKKLSNLIMRVKQQGTNSKHKHLLTRQKIIERKKKNSRIKHERSFGKSKGSMSGN